MCKLIWDKDVITGLEPCCPCQVAGQDAWCTLLYQALARLVGSDKPDELRAMAVALLATQHENTADALYAIQALLRSPVCVGESPGGN
jgi:hypothetical protein